MRDENGRFTIGNTGGPGRPPRVTEQAYINATMTNCSLDQWAAIVQRAVQDAIAGDPQARTWLGHYLIGKPRERIEITRNEIVNDEFNELSDEELRALIDKAEADAEQAVSG